jgi:DNA-binding beta-propeller fold protein YncE
MRAAAVFLWLPVFALAAQSNGVTQFQRPVATGRLLDPAGDAIDLGSMPVSAIPTPDPDKVLVVLSGWREQGVQIVDIAAKRVIQTLPQGAAFFGAAFSPDGRRFYVSGGNEDVIYCYAWNEGQATLTKKIAL